MKAESFVDLIKRFNPFGFKDEKKESMMFTDYGAVYLYTIQKLFEEFPRGYIDVALFLHKMTLQPLAVTTMFCKRSMFLKCINDGVYLCEPDKKGLPPKECYANLMKAFHTLSETQFSQEYFDKAWERFVSEE